jgi:hypothetical protein
MKPRNARLLVLLPDELLSEIDLARRNSPDLPPRAEMIRRLIRKGLAYDSMSLVLLGKYADEMAPSRRPDVTRIEADDERP